jgi:pimeloyl-ACP methyl ester carboxylesterase
MLDLGKYRLHVVCAGRGAPSVVFESGIAASSLSWSHVLPAVSKSARVCAYDRAGLAWSDAPRGRRGFEEVLGDLGAVLSRTGLEPPFVLVGHSFGCFVVCAYASRQPSNVAGLVLVDPPAAREWRRPTGRQARMLWGGIQLSRVGALLARLGVVRACGALVLGGAPRMPRAFLRVFGPTATSTVERLVGEIGKLPPEIHPIVQELWCQPKCFQAMADHLRLLRESAASVADLASLPDVPLVVLSSGSLSADRIEEHRALARLSSRGRHVIAARSGHWIQFDEPQLIVAAVFDVLDEL